MKKILIVLALMCLCSTGLAGNKGVFVKGYMNGYKLFEDLNINMKDKTVNITDDESFVFTLVDGINPLITLTTSGDLVFCGTSYKEGITLKELLECLRLLAPEHFDKKVKEIQED